MYVITNKLCLLLIICQLAGITLVAQDKGDVFTFKGTLRSAATNEAIPYGSISIKGKNVGVSANERGQFEFPIRKDFFYDSLEISALGYKRLRLTVKSMMDKDEHMIALMAMPYVLDEIVVESFSAQGLVKEALEKFDDNFPSSPYEMDVYYRSTLKENTTYVKLLECVFKAYDRGFQHTDIAGAVDVAYQAVRKSNEFTNPQTSLPAPFFKPQWLMTVENYARNKAMLSENVAKAIYEFELDTTTYLNDKLIYIVNANVKKGIDKFIFSVKFFIRADDFAIVRMDFDGKDKVSLIRPSGIPHRLKLQVLQYKATYVFKEFNGKMFMHYLNDYVIYKWLDGNSGAVINSNEENSQAIIQNITYPKDGKSTFSHPANRRLAAIPLMPYKADDWKNNDMVRQIPYDPKITADLTAKGGDLEKQFAANGAKHKTK